MTVTDTHQFLYIIFHSCQSYTKTGDSFMIIKSRLEWRTLSQSTRWPTRAGGWLAVWRPITPSCTPSDSTVRLCLSLLQIRIGCFPCLQGQEIKSFNSWTAKKWFQLISYIKLIQLKITCINLLVRYIIWQYQIG